jgi:hypothetical protein
MIKVERYKTVVTSDPTLPVLPDSEDAQAFADFPDFVFASHPEYIVGRQCIERAQGGLCDAALQDFLFGAFPNGAQGFDMLNMSKISGSYGKIARNPHVQPADNWSVCFAIHFQGTEVSLAGGGVNIYTRNVIPPGSTRLMNLRVSSSRVMTFFNESGAVIADTIPCITPTAPPFVYMITFSSTNGIAMYRNGQLVAQNPDYTTPLDGALQGETTNVFATSGALGSTSPLTKALAGALYHTSIDLSNVEHAAKRAAINAEMMRKWITV